MSDLLCLPCVLGSVSLEGQLVFIYLFTTPCYMEVASGRTIRKLMKTRQLGTEKLCSLEVETRHLGHGCEEEFDFCLRHSWAEAQSSGGGNLRTGH